MMFVETPAHRLPIVPDLDWDVIRARKTTQTVPQRYEVKTRYTVKREREVVDGSSVEIKVFKAERGGS